MRRRIKEEVDSDSYRRKVTLNYMFTNLHIGRCGLSTKTVHIFANKLTIC